MVDMDEILRWLGLRRNNNCNYVEYFDFKALTQNNNYTLSTKYDYPFVALPCQDIIPKLLFKINSRLYAQIKKKSEIYQKIYTLTFLPTKYQAINYTNGKSSSRI